MRHAPKSDPQACTLLQQSAYKDGNVREGMFCRLNQFGRTPRDTRAPHTPVASAAHAAGGPAADPQLPLGQAFSPILRHVSELSDF